MSEEPYTSSEDSALLRGALRGLSGGSCLEMGAGNCGTLLDLLRGFRLVVGTDIGRPAGAEWKGRGIDFLLADGASRLRSETFDLVAFNPPYLPVEVSEDRAVEGGKGLEVPKAFLRDALRVVKRTGRVVVLLYDEADAAELEEICGQASFAMTKTATMRVYFEELSVYSAAAP